MIDITKLADKWRQEELTTFGDYAFVVLLIDGFDSIERIQK